MARPQSETLPVKTTSNRILGTLSYRSGTGTGGPRSFVFTLRDRPRATRASVPKVRTGCVTCKKRHVKCDEAKPECKRCVKWQGFCGGYRSTADTRDAAESNPPLPKPVESDLEDLYFGHWTALSATLGGGLFPSTLFGETVPQLSRIEPAVRYAVVAMGALASSKAPDILPGAPGSEANNPHYKNALAYYGHALGIVRQQRDVCSDYTLRVAIICCVLFACFEALHDSCDASIRHVNHGLMMVDQLMITPTDESTKTSQTTQSAPPLPSDGALSAFIDDDELLQTFQRLEFLSFGVSLLQGLPLPSRIYLSLASPFDLTRPFTDLLEARRCLDQFQHACLRAVVAVSSSLPSVSSLLTPLDSWLTAFRPLSDQCSSDNTSHTLAYYQSMSLLLQYHTAYTGLTLLPFGNKSIPPLSVLDSLTSHYSEMLRLAETLMACHPSAEPRGDGENGFTITMDHGPTLAVLMVATGCSDARLREEALVLLDRYPRRDGFWDRRRIFRCVGPVID